MKLIETPKNEIKEILERLGDKNEEQKMVCLKQPFINVPGVGEVSSTRLTLDDCVLEAVQRVNCISTDKIVLSDELDNSSLNHMNWFQSIILAKELELELLTNKEYWQCLMWASTNNTEFARNLKQWTWTNTLLVFGNNEEENRLLKMYNYSGKIPAVMENLEIIMDLNTHVKYRLKEGTIVRPRQSLCQKECKFDFNDMEENTGLPFRHNEKGLFMYNPPQPNKRFLHPIACGFSWGLYNTYSIYTNWRPQSTGDIGFFVKHKQK